MSSVIFKRVEEIRIKEIFRNVLDNYPSLSPHIIVLEKKGRLKTTMRARPVFRDYFSGKKNQTFSVQFTGNTQLKDRISIHDVPDQVLAGWFAHELGHVVDYLDHNMFSMIQFGIYYGLSGKFRRKAEYRADEYAIQHGLAREILATKSFILEHGNFPETYQKRIRKYYMSISEVHLMLEEEELPSLHDGDADLLG